jgi:hypothetical protein
MTLALAGRKYESRPRRQAYPVGTSILINLAVNMTLTIDLAPMAYMVNGNNLSFDIYLIDYSIVSNADTKGALNSSKLATPFLQWILCQRIYSLNDARKLLSI